MTLARLPGPAAARAWCAARRVEGATVGFVPTMGALHEGHLDLVARAVGENDVACVSVFVNPLQFDDPRDLARYPRDFEADARLLARVGCHMVFTGTLAQFFPEAPGPDRIDLRDPGPRARGLEGASRKGHFAGVATIVARLFDVVRPDVAYFGEKDFQQSLVVRDLAAELGYPRIEVCATHREPDGLASSSRNLLLDPESRERAVVLVRALRRAREAWRAGERDAERLRAVLAGELDHPWLELDYAEVRDAERWTGESAPVGELRSARAIVAARIGGVRLIDNMALDDRAP